MTSAMTRRQHKKFSTQTAKHQEIFGEMKKQLHHFSLYMESKTGLKFFKKNQIFVAGAISDFSLAKKGKFWFPNSVEILLCVCVCVFVSFSDECNQDGWAFFPVRFEVEVWLTRAGPRGVAEPGPRMSVC